LLFQADAALFRLLLGDLFPSLDLPAVELGSLGSALEVELEKLGMQKHPTILQKYVHSQLTFLRLMRSVEESVLIEFVLIN
jgi:hypothetical protein